MEGARKHDLASTVTQYMDGHMSLPILDFLMDQEIYSPESLVRAKLECVKSSNMAEYALSIYQDAGLEVPERMDNELDAAIERIDSAESKAEKVIQFFDNAERIAELRGEDGERAITPSLLEREEGITREDLDTYYQWGKQTYESGDYAGASGVLFNLEGVLRAGGMVPSNPKMLSILWGKLAATILNSDWDAALVEVKALASAISSAAGDKDNPNFGAVQVLQARSWLLHWSLFVCFNHADGRNFLIEFFMSPENLQAVQNNCPWLLRYITVALVMIIGRHRNFNDILKIITQERHAYSDPITEFLECLRVDFDFEGAQKKLKACEEILRMDYFLSEATEAFMSGARMFIFETFCRIHHTLDMSMLADRLAYSPTEAEKFIVDLIRGSKLDARIDSAKNYVVIGSGKNGVGVHARVQERTKDLAARSMALSQTLKQMEAKEERDRKRRILAAMDEY
uniref:Eukaryotic translation initiation factor 3 subunit E n=1 Tax=Pinguiococcus pyrenoidosus TaxID=172671 RepID=A0A7R9Y8R2_9STRA